LHQSSHQPAVNTNVDPGDRLKTDGSVDTSPVAHTAFSAATTPPPAAHFQQITFVLDAGAACHMTYERSDFKTFQPTPPHAMKILLLSRIYAVGVGTVELVTAGGHKITLDNVLFVPSLGARILSVRTFTLSGDYSVGFDPRHCWIAKRDGTIISRCNVDDDIFRIVAFKPRVCAQEGTTCHRSVHLAHP
jgi:hypothetical protein